MHLILHDTAADGTRMLFANRSHRVPRSASGVRTEENVTSRYSITDCAGPRGTLYMFDNSGLHRPHAVANSLRATFEFYFTPGNNIQNMAHAQPENDIRRQARQGIIRRRRHDEIAVPDDFSAAARDAGTREVETGSRRRPFHMKYVFIDVNTRANMPNARLLGW